MSRIGGRPNPFEARRKFQVFIFSHTKYYQLPTLCTNEGHIEQ